ncbi:MAG: hypothetical protein A2901_06625 [Elusimicrobia bacterium RIFCSPLOWO2_01_FULL_54_10]|nr:MAG: hypothetical protein A2901_06625 [Elusimicrobia bacterium RIFCSPLOWO2_01_FULL_54_10]
MSQERRGHVRFPVINNVGEPVELDVMVGGKKVAIPGYIINLSAGGVGIIALGKESSKLTEGTPFNLDLNLPHLESNNVEGKIIRIEKGKSAKAQHSDDEWFLSLQFTKIKPAFLQHINRMAEDWSICETKIQMRLPDVCFRKCSYWDLCEKTDKLKEPALKNGK